MGSLDLSHGLNIQPAAKMAAWSSVSSRFIPLGECALEPLQRGLPQASIHYDRRAIGELTCICEVVVDFLHTADIPNAVPTVWDLLLATGRVQVSCSWDPPVSDIPEYVLKARKYAD